MYDNFKISKSKIFSIYLLAHHSGDDRFYSYITGELDSTNINHRYYFDEVLKHVKKIEFAASHFIRGYEGESGELDEAMKDWFGNCSAQYRILLSYDLFRDMVLHEWEEEKRKKTV
ncbi:hypothetical protein EZS27_029330 [termite gut metagenome]|uniref:Uncharacterized protein n=1 Tax=termite gut metagenome TaxID=433724 RepID=A0A5J4QHG9_9ZZZZ